MLHVRRLFIRNYSGAFKPVNKVKVRGETLKTFLSCPGDVIDWDAVRQLMSSEKFVKPSNLDGLVVEFCQREKSLDLAKDYIKYLKSKNHDINDGCIGKLLRAYSNHSRNCELTEEERAEIVRMSSLLIEKYPFIDSLLGENLIRALSLTSKWLQCLELLEKVKSTETPTQPTYTAIIVKALEEDRVDIAWKLIDDALSTKGLLGNSVYQKFFTKFRENDEQIEKMLNSIFEHCVLLPEKMLEELQEILSRSHKCEIVKLTRAGRCKSCSNELPNIDLNEEEFSKLSNKFLGDVLVRKDVFIKSTPDELKRFKDFVEMTKPFDCVIDGLNVAYSHGTSKGPQMFAKNIAAVVRHFVEAGQKCLVIGRKHMNKWDPEKMAYVRRHSSLFLADNISQDDPFMLYAALKSGPNTKIFSRDLMRGHSVLLDKESKILFRRWQQQNQHSLITTLQKNQILVQEPIAFETRAHKVGSHWHIPFTSENINFNYESFDLPSSWLCLKIV